MHREPIFIQASEFMSNVSHITSILLSCLFVRLFPLLPLRCARRICIYIYPCGKWPLKKFKFLRYVPYGLCIIFALDPISLVVTSCSSTRAWSFSFFIGCIIFALCNHLSQKHCHLAKQNTVILYSILPYSLLWWVAYGFIVVKSVSANVWQHFEDTHTRRTADIPGTCSPKWGSPKRVGPGCLVQGDIMY